MSGSNDAGRLLVRIEATTAQLRQQLQAAEQQVATTAAKMDGQLKQADRAFARLEEASKAVQAAAANLSSRLGPLGGMMSALGPAGAAAGAGIAVLGLGLTAIAKAGDQATATMARLQSATGSLTAAQTVYEGLFRLSQQTGVAVAESAGAFSRFAVAAKEIGGTNDQVLRLVSGIQKAGLVAGASAQEAGAAVQQLGQALASGSLQGDELRSVLENMPQLAQALARELGVSIGRLRQMGSEGQLSAEKVFPALLAAAEKMAAEFDKMPLTIGRASGALAASGSNFGARLDHALKVSQGIAAALKAAADALNTVGRTMMPTAEEAAARAVASAQERVTALQSRRPADYDETIARFRRPGMTEAEARRRAMTVEGPRGLQGFDPAEMARAEEQLRQALAAQAAIQRDAREMQRADAEDSARGAAEARRTRLSLEIREVAEFADKRLKIERETAEKLRKIAEAEAAGVTRLAGANGVEGAAFNADAARAGVLREQAEALKKLAEEEGKAGEEARKAADKRGEVIHKLEQQIAVAEEALAATRAGTTGSREAAIALETEARVREAGIPGVEKRTEAERKSAEAIGASVAKLEKLKQATKEAEDAARKAREWHERSWNDVANIGERAFDRLANSIVDAFVFGQGAAVNFGNITRGILGSIISDIAKLGVVNPILNSLFTPTNGARPTLGGAFGAGGSLSSFLVGAPAVAGGSFADLGGITWGGSAATSGLLGNGGNLFGVAGMGGLLQGAGIGAGIGGLTAGLMGGNSLYGSLGGAAGAMLGQMLIPIPGIGALIGGALGGGLGGLIGPGESVRGWSYAIRGNGEGLGAGIGDQIKMTDVFYNESGKAQFDAANQSIAAINEFLRAQGLTVQGARAVGGNKDGPDDSWGGAASFGDALADLRFGSSTNTLLNSYLSGQSFSDPAKLAEAVQGFKAAQTAIEALGAEAVPAFTTALKAINDNFDAAVEQARKYGLAEENLTTARARAITALEAQRAETLRQSDVALDIRRMAATGAGQDAELARQAEAARQELARFGDTLDSLALTAADRAARLVELEEVQAAERAAIIARYGEQAAEALRQAGGSIRAYLDSLATGTAAGASPTDRLAAAQAAFDRDRTLALGGDRDALGRVTQSADALLTAGRDVYASGAGFQSIRGAVTGGLSSLPVVQSYDAMMAGSLSAIQAAITAGTLNTATTILPTGNAVTIAAGLSLGGVEALLATTNAIATAQHASIVAAHASLVALHQSVVALHATATAAHATAINSEGALYALGVIQATAANDNAARLDLSNRLAADASRAATESMAAMNRILVDAAAAATTGQALANTIAAKVNSDTAAARGYLSKIDNTLAAANVYTLDLRARLDAANSIAATDAANTVAGLAALNTITADASRAATESMAALNTILVDAAAAATTGQALANQIAAKVQSDTAAARSYLSKIDNTLAANNNYTLDLRARLDAGNTIAGTAAGNVVASFAALNTITADASRAATESMAALNRITVDASAASTASLALANTIAAKVSGDTGAMRAYSSFIDNTLKAANNYAIEQTTELRGLRQQVNELKAALSTLTATVQAAGIATATEARAAGLLVADRVEQVDGTLRRAA